MRRIAVTNQKGGVGKTTTTVNLGAALAHLGQRVLVCDFDPQCNLTVHLDVDPASEAPNLYDLLHGRASLSEVALATEHERLWVAPAGVDLAGVELELANEVGRETILGRALDADAAQGGESYDILLVDCPPSLGLLSLNALVACEEVLVPIQAEFFALQGLGKLLEVVGLVQQRLNPKLRISCLVSCRYDPSTNLSRAVIADVREHFGEILAETVIRRNVKLAEAPSHGKTIFAYAPDSRGAQDYLSLARELLGAVAGAAPQPTPATTKGPETTEERPTEDGAEKAEAVQEVPGAGANGAARPESKGAPAAAPAAEPEAKAEPEAASHGRRTRSAAATRSSTRRPSSSASADRAAADAPVAQASAPKGAEAEESGEASGG